MPARKARAAVTPTCKEARPQSIRPRTRARMQDRNAATHAPQSSQRQDRYRSSRGPASQALPSWVALQVRASKARACQTSLWRGWASWGAALLMLISQLPTSPSPTSQLSKPACRQCGHPFVPNSPLLPRHSSSAHKQHGPRGTITIPGLRNGSLHTTHRQSPLFS